MRFSREQYFRIWLAGVDGIGARTFLRLMERYGSAEAVWENMGPEMAFIGRETYKSLTAAKSREKAAALIESIERCGASVVFQEESEYPPLLLEITDPPPLLYVRGQRDLSDAWCVGVVGTRQPTVYGIESARAIAYDLAGSGACVVSGFARGIDQSAHAAALDAGGRTIAFLGCGVDIVYPPESVELFQRMIACGGSVVSEFPPGTQPIGRHFPMRNRLISGVSRGVLIVEGKEKSGALLTCQSALEQNRDVFALPGQVDSQNSMLCHQLIRDGAVLVRSAQDILDEIRAELVDRPRQGSSANNEKSGARLAATIKSSIRQPKRKTKIRINSDNSAASGTVQTEGVEPAAPEPLSEMTDEESRVYAILKEGTSAANIDKIVELTGLNAASVNTVLTMLTIKRIIE